MDDRPQHPDGDEMPTPPEVERALRALAEQETDDSLPAPSDRRLLAYRQGGLTPAEARELEDLLAHSAAGRRRLVELAGLDRSLALRRVRRAVLAGAARKRRIPVWAAAAAGMAAALVLALIALFPRPGALPAGLAYDVAARGLAEVRSPALAPDQSPAGTPIEVRAYPGTTVRILLRPRGDAPAGVAFALFRREGGALRRVRELGEVRRAGGRGTAAFEGAAADLLGTRAPGVHPLYAVASPRQLPARVALAPGEDPAAALRATGRLVYPVTVTLLPDEADSEEDER